MWFGHQIRRLFQAHPTGRRLGQIQNTMWGPDNFFGLETPWDPFGGAGKGCWRDNCNHLTLLQPSHEHKPVRGTLGGVLDSF